MSPSENPPPAQPRPTKPPFWRRAFRAIGLILAGAVVLMLIWAGAQVLLRRPQPELLFTYADLPKVPPPEENGWDVLRLEIHTIGEPQRPDKDITEICDGKATFTDRWPRAESRASKISALAQDETTKQWLALVDKAAARPRFADGCPIGFEPDCPRPLHMLALHQMQEAVVLHDALSQRWDDALKRAATMLRVDIDFLPSARSTLTQAVARAHLHRSLKLAELLLDGAASEKQNGRGPDAARLAQFARDVDPLFKKIYEEDMAPLRVVIAEYLFSVYAIQNLKDSPQGKHSRSSTIFYDPGHALEMLNERFERYAAYARSGGAGKPPEFPRSRLWFLRNPGGHLVLEATRGALENHVPSISKDNKLLLADQAALQKRLTALMQSP